LDGVTGIGSAGGATAGLGEPVFGGLVIGPEEGLGPLPGALSAGAGSGFLCGWVTFGGVSTGTGGSLGAVNPGDTFDGGAVGAGAVNAGGASDFWWLVVGVAGRLPSVDAGGDQMGMVVRGLSSLVKSRGDLSARSFISGPELLVALSLEMNCASEAFRFITGDEAWILALVADLVVVDAVAGGAQSRLRGSCQSRLMFQFWYRFGLNPWAWSHCVRW
jgi:hypothetical protein